MAGDGMMSQKRELRAIMRERRAAMPPEERGVRSRRIAQQLIDAVLAQANVEAERPDAGDTARDALCAYIPLPEEADIRPAIAWCWQRGIPVAAPRVSDEPGRFELYPYAPDAPLKRGRYGLLEPDPGVANRWDKPGAIRWMLVPGLAFDRSGGRLGYGGGYYDRYLARHFPPDAARPLLIAPAFGVQIVDRVPTEPTDRRVDLIVTETGVWDVRRQQAIDS